MSTFNIDKDELTEDYIKNKQKMSVNEYELTKQGLLKSMTYLGKIQEHEKNDNRGFTLNYCDKGCIIPGIEGLNYCPKGHTGFHTKFFPFYAVLKTEPIFAYNRNLSYLTEDLVRIAPNARKGNSLEYEIRRIETKEIEIHDTQGLLNWSPLYVPISEIF